MGEWEWEWEWDRDVLAHKGRHQRHVLSIWSSLGVGWGGYTGVPFRHECISWRLYPVFPQMHYDIHTAWDSEMPTEIVTVTLFL